MLLRLSVSCGGGLSKEPLGLLMLWVMGVGCYLELQGFGLDEASGCQQSWWRFGVICGCFWVRGGGVVKQLTAPKAPKQPYLRHSLATFTCSRRLLCPFCLLTVYFS